MYGPVLTHRDVSIYHCCKTDEYDGVPFPAPLFFAYNVGAPGDEADGFDVRSLPGFDSHENDLRGREHHYDVIRTAIEHGLDLAENRCIPAAHASALSPRARLHLATAAHGSNHGRGSIPPLPVTGP